jgi:hypothetical protein
VQLTSDGFDGYKNDIELSRGEGTVVHIRNLVWMTLPDGLRGEKERALFLGCGHFSFEEKRNNNDRIE